MTDYRVYRIDPAGKTTGPPLILQCEGDDAALILATRAMMTRQQSDGHMIEIWDGARRVITIPADTSTDWM
jgi:hypothetical protein